MYPPQSGAPAEEERYVLVGGCGGSGRASYLITSCPTVGVASGAARLLLALAAPGKKWLPVLEPVCSVRETDRLTRRPALEPWGRGGPHRQLLFISRARYLSQAAVFHSVSWFLFCLGWAHIVLLRVYLPVTVLDDVLIFSCVVLGVQKP